MTRFLGIALTALFCAAQISAESLPSWDGSSTPIEARPAPAAKVAQPVAVAVSGVASDREFNVEFRDGRWGLNPSTPPTGDELTIQVSAGDHVTLRLLGSFHFPTNFDVDDLDIHQEFRGFGPEIHIVKFVARRVGRFPIVNSMFSPPGHIGTFVIDARAR